MFIPDILKKGVQYRIECIDIVKGTQMKLVLTVGLLFIINFPLRKPGWKMLTLLVAIVSCALIKIYFF